MSKKKSDDTTDKLKEAFESVFKDISLDFYPKEAVKVGTIVRASRLDRLGAVMDAFYGELDEDDQKIIIYTILIFPQSDKLSISSRQSEQYYITNEYEYEVTAYLMMNPIDIKLLAKNLGGGIYI